MNAATLESPAVADEPARSAPKAPAHEHDDRPEAEPVRPSYFGTAVVAVLLVVLLTTLAVVGFRSRAKQSSDRESAAAPANEKPRVVTATAAAGPVRIERVLPGNALPLLETALYARTSGYLKRWLVDIGDKVKEGQLLAEIETPEVDAQLLQARAVLNESKATLTRSSASADLAKIQLERTRRLVRSSSASQQEYDDSEGAHKIADAVVRVSEATIQANAASVERLEELKRFQKVKAPFAGVVTARNFDPGALLVADNTAVKELFHISQIDTLRVFADVPQTYSTAIRAGQPAPVFRREAPGREYAGVVARTTRSLDPQTRTLRVEVHVPNADGALLPGMYLQVRFQLESSASLLRVPGAAIITRGDGARVAVVDSQGAIHYRPVQLGRDFGTLVEVTSGLTPGEKVVVRPGDDLPDGTLVEVADAAAK